ncbi:U-box domain-containing protein 32-like isoform X2 [Coffea eugenioides]|uniref:U-box domain-containing protein 32-like isoform X2 n=1 Tax=Coffea eugenioides TaxID=49369 RepID=UPI000F615811|nr:U-box domain-containing protein 32-like isoform X2 [Coffea eugenioides]
MGEGEIRTEGVCDVDDTIFVAVGENVEEGKSLLSWALKSFAGRNICILHVHQPTHSPSLMNERLSEAVEKFQEIEHQKMHSILNQYLQLVEQVEIRPGKIWIEMSNIEQGILHIISHHGVKWLVMGAAAEKYYSENLSELKSNKAIFVCHHAPVPCQIWFSCKGCLIRTRSDEIGSHLAGVVPLSSKTNKNLTHSMTGDGSSLYLPHSMTGDGSSLYLPSNSQNSPFSSSVDFLGDKLEVKGRIDNQSECAIIDAEKSKQRQTEEPVRGWRGDRDMLETYTAEASETFYLKEINSRSYMEDLLKKQRQELEKMKNKHNQIVKELQLVQNQKLSLERKFMENCSTEEELEEKILQAVKLLISFKGKRDLLWKEQERALRESHKFQKMVKEDVCAMHVSHFFDISFSEIIEATRTFDPSMKIGEGRFGSVYKGIIHHVKVAIKMLPSCGSQSDSDFEHKAEILSRVRHPNLVTLLCACTESRSLIYEYLENGSLEDHLAGHLKSRSLPWQLRLRIASEICSALIFLHAHKSSIVHGNLKLSNILLDANFVSKISDLGIKNFQNDENPYGKNDLEASIYLEPEYVDGRHVTESDVYSFGIILLQLLTARPASSIIRDMRCAMEVGNVSTVLDHSAGDWPLEQVTLLAFLALRCCEENRLNQPDLVAEVWPVIEPMRDLCTLSCLGSTSSRLDSTAQQRIPSNFVCPIFQEVMKDPHIAADGFTYEGDAIKGWLNSGHKTSPMTNLQLDHCDLLPNYALYYAIQEWQQKS